jgi:hypothetical protein
MAKKPRKTNLAPEHLLLLAALIELVTKLLDLLSKVVNYASSFWKRGIQLPQSKAEVGICAIRTRSRDRQETEKINWSGVPT